jgi:multicomponent Na+:H+ antiporter subunit A
VPNLGGRITAVVLAAGLLVLLALLLLSTEATYRVGAFTWRNDWALVIALVLTAGGGILTTIPRHHLTQVLGTSIVSYGLVAVFAIFSAPDVAVVMALIAIISSIFFFAILTMLPTRALMEQAAKPERFWWRNAVVGVMAGLLATAVAWSVLSREPAAESVADQLILLTPDVHALDVVTAILADFRGLDTMGEITVIAVVLLGLLAVLRLKRHD